MRIDQKSGEIIGCANRQPARKKRKKGEKRIGRPKRFAGYQKQADETSILVPGSKIAQQIVVDIFRLYHHGNIGAHRIIQRLREKGVQSSFGSEWNLSGVHYILRNPICIGKEVRHRWTKVLYHTLGSDGPIPMQIDQDQVEKDGKMSVPQTERPRHEWQLVDKPNMKDFLPPDVRDLAIAHITKLFDEDVVAANQEKRGRRKTKHEDNPYVFSHILHSKKTGRPMRGETTTKNRPSGKQVFRPYIDFTTASRAITGLHARRVPS